MANSTLELRISFKWWLYPSMFIYVLWCKFLCIETNVEGSQFFRAGITITPESKTK